MFFFYEQSQMMNYIDPAIFWTINTLLIYEFSEINMGLFFKLNYFKLRKRVCMSHEIHETRLISMLSH